MHPLLRNAGKDLLQRALLRDRFVWRLAEDAGQLALTFDDGPHPEVTPRLLDFLAARGARAAFFVIGANAERHPALMRRIADEGHTIGNHTHDHLEVVGMDRDTLALQLDRATFRVVANDVLLEIARLAPATMDALGAIKGMPRGMLDRAGRDVLAAVQRGLAVPDGQLPKFPRAPRWEKDPEFDDKVGRLKSVRDDAAKRLELDPGVLCSRERMETIARALPRTLEELEAIPGIRKWQSAEMGAGFIGALERFKARKAERETPREDDSPYR